MLMSNQVANEFRTCFSVELVGGIADTGAVGNELLSIVDALGFKVGGGLAVGYKTNIHRSFSSSLSVSGCTISATATASTTKLTVCTVCSTCCKAWVIIASN